MPAKICLVWQKNSLLLGILTIIKQALVSDKEGRRSVQVADLSEFWSSQKEIKLLDANLLACPDPEKLILQLAESRAYVDLR